MIILDGDGFERLVGIIRAAKLEVGRSEVAQVVEVGRIELGCASHRAHGLIEMLEAQLVLAQPRVDLVRADVHSDRFLINLDRPLKLPCPFKGDGEIEMAERIGGVEFQPGFHRPHCGGVLLGVQKILHVGEDLEDGRAVFRVWPARAQLDFPRGARAEVAERPQELAGLRVNRAG